MVPETCTAAALAMGEAPAIILIERTGFGKDDFAFLHPAGSIGE